jgi:hypothetical protein
MDTVTFRGISTPPTLEIDVFGDGTLLLRSYAKMPNRWSRFWRRVFIGTTYRAL